MHQVEVIRLQLLRDRTARAAADRAVVELGNRPNKGIKVRWTHPSMLEDGMGKYLGRAKNFRVSSDGTKALADMHISESAFTSPMGNLGGYVLSLAQEDPDAFGTSAVVQYNTIEPADIGELPTIRVTRLYASDVVDEPAANDGLFSANPGVFSKEVKAMLDAMLEREPAEKVLERLAKEIESQLGCVKILSTETSPKQESEMSEAEIHEEAEALEAVTEDVTILK